MERVKTVKCKLTIDEEQAALVLDTIALLSNKVA